MGEGRVRAYLCLCRAAFLVIEGFFNAGGRRKEKGRKWRLSNTDSTQQGRVSFLFFFFGRLVILENGVLGGGRIRMRMGYVDICWFARREKGRKERGRGCVRFR